MKQKVLFFDYWTVGIHNFLPVAQRLRARGVECLLVHLGSWRDPHVPTEQVIEGLCCRDIRAYGGDLRRALVEEKPQAVLSLNTTHTMDRVLHRLSRSLGIRSLYMMHGILSAGADSDEGVRQGNRHWSLARRLAKIPKYADLSVRYVRAIAQDRMIDLLHPMTYGHFVQLVLQPGAAFERPWKHKDICADEALVYSSVYRDLMIETRGYVPDAVVVVGNPNLDEVFALKKRTDAAAVYAAYLADIGLPVRRRFVVCIEDALVEQGVEGWTDDYRVAELDQIAAATLAAGFDLVIKMHPGSRPDRVLAHFSGKPGIHVVLKADLAKLIGASAATVGHVSTALMIPIVLDKPVLVPTWSPGLERTKFYIGERVAEPVAEPAALTEKLSDLGAVLAKLHEHRARFEDKFIGPMDGKAWDRIVERILLAVVH